MDFRTILTPRRAGFTLSPSRPVVTLGSCFADNIALRMRRCLWNAINPLGTLYNPLSIAQALRITLDADAATFSRSLFTSGPHVHSWLFDSRFSALSQPEAMRRFEHASASLAAALFRAQALFVTFGTSWCYKLARNESVTVANCHKQPSAMFTRFRLTVDDVVQTWLPVIASLRSRFPDIQIVFTVSPVRHLKDGFEGNARSKAVLMLAIEQICGHTEACTYFPAYEILNDDLRDYRFYASDMTHPTAEAVEYIWEAFIHTYLDANGQALLRQGESLARAFAHRPLLPETPDDTARRLAGLEARAADFISLNPGMLHPRQSGSLT